MQVYKLLDVTTGLAIHPCHCIYSNHTHFVVVTLLGIKKVTQNIFNSEVFDKAFTKSMQLFCTNQNNLKQL